jgi:hypothetical protein
MDWAMIGVGCGGAAIPDIIRIIQGRYSPALPGYIASPNFWIGFVFLIIIGALAAMLGEAKNFKEALAFGYAAPELISRLLSSGTPPTRGGLDASAWRHFWFY